MTRAEWNKLLKTFSTANNKKAVVQILNTFLPYLILMTITVASYSFGLPLIVVFVLAAVSGFFMVRSFILFHDCTHDSFVSTKKGNHIIGSILGIFVFAPYLPWKKDHGIHHGAVGNLDKRGVGDVWTLTVEEYEGKSWYIKGLYRLFRHPLFLFGVAPYFLFGVVHRFGGKNRSKEEKRSYLLTNGGIFLVGLIYSLIFGFLNYFIVQSLILFVAASSGVWLFYVQHQFEDVYWEDEKDYNSVMAAIKGSTYYKLPLVLEWLSGYIGYHHIHHLNARIPNYYLKKCYNSFEELKEVKTVTFIQSIPLAFLQLYDTKKRKLISFRQFAKGA